MGKIKVIGSGSSGNCYLLETTNEILIIEAGLTFAKIQNGLNFDLSKVVGCLISHEHGDHISSATSLMASGINLYASEGTFEAKKMKGSYCNVISHLEGFKVGEFTITPLHTQHDCAEPMGFVIDHNETGRILFATDTYYFKYKVGRINHYLLECNYQIEILEANKRSEDKKISGRAWGTQKRLLESHFELRNVCNYLETNLDNNVKNIMLLHRSSVNSNKDQMLEEINKSVDTFNFDEKINVLFAESGVEIEVNPEF